MKVKKNIPRDFFLFTGLSDDEFKSAEALCGFYTREFASGETVYTETQFERSLCYITKGRVRVYKKSEGHSTLLNTIEAGGAFGVAVAFSAEQKYPTLIVAKERTEVIFIPKDNLESLFCEYPKTAINYIHFLSDRIRFLNDKIDSFTKGSAREKVVKFILDKSKISDSSHILVKNMSQLASSLGIARASLYRILSDLSEQKTVTYTQSEITIIDKNKLERQNTYEFFW